MVPDKTMNTALHKSPPRSWLGIRLRLNEKPPQDDECVVCQHPGCTEHRRAAKVCHHPDCQDLNSKSPLHLCESCDSRCHPDETDNMHFDRHPRFHLQPQGSILARNVSTRSCPPRTSPPSDLEEEEEGATERGERKPGKMKPKKKHRRRYTDDPSKECFTLKFDLNVDIDTEIVPAMKKKTLRELLGPVFERKGIELSRVDLFLDQSNTPLSLHFEAYPFGGHYLKVKARPGDELKVDQGVKDLRFLSLPNIKSSSGISPYILNPTNDKVDHGSLSRQDNVDILGQARRRKNMMEFLGDASIPSPDSLAQLGGSLPSVAPLGVPKNRPASRFSGFFFPSGAGKELDRVELLNNRLQFYTYNGLPKVSSFHQDSWEEDDEEPGLTLEDSWQQLLENPETLSRRQVHQQEAIWELIHTEATYIKKLKVITDLFLCGLLHLQDCGLLSEVEPGKLFSNIQDLVRVHATLWVQVMEPVLERARRDRSLLDPMHLLQGFQTFGSRFQPYLRYCMEEERCMEYMRSQLRDNELFRIYITWAEGNKQCARLKLADMLVKPHQRLTKYPLLLKTILKKTDEPAAKDALLSMLACVDSFINSVDTQMQQKQEQQKLAAISARVESYEAVEGGTEEVERILREFNHIDLMAPMIDTSPEETRQLHLEGALRMKEGKDSRMDVYCFLFTDLLLVTKPVKRVEKVKVIRPPLLVQNVVCRELKDPGSFVLIYLNEFKSAVAAYSFQANSAPQGRSWIDALSSAQSQLQRLRSEEGRRRRARLRQRLEDGEEDERGEESCTSTASSPRLQNKEQHHTGSSDGSTETLSVMDADESEACLDSSTLQADPVVTPMPLPDGSPVAPGSQKAQGAGEADPLPQSSERRSVSVDSAYGTLSPESLLEMQTLTATSEEEVSVGTGGGGEDEEEGERERGGDRGEELEELEDQDQEEEEEEEEEEGAENRGSPCSLLSPARHLKPRRRAPVQLRLPCLQRLAFKCRSEDNLLQCVSGNGSRPLARADTEPARVSPQWPDGGLGHSRSLCELIPSSAGHKVEAPLPDMEKEESCQLSHSLPATLLADTLRRARGDYKRGQMSYGCSDAEGSCSASEEDRGCGKSSPQQKKKLTMAQLCRIRTTLVLNSTLTAS
ncbi:pleckstrin homology domain-containing family G member 5 isoform X2 [Electrophorus electricus]|uniref:pleckstrin homology domain-containing family G member 5 isoform X2 n=1 Tax=Electrophorus electricus TaxID=8005 RepID=UPI0015D0073F|nr:pleckstrin homology domain-containing family G member 5 isoform X2 [Electrophorus electricus]XP_035377408.1 pleckstrin homology domain-containing family G member 5 isoform X2 [Electrophorus electricus]